MSYRSEQIAMAVAVSAVVGLTAWWKSLSPVAALFATAVAAGSFFVVDWGLGRREQSSMLASSNVSQIEGARTAAVVDSSASVEGGSQDVESSSHARANSTANLSSVSTERLQPRFDSHIGTQETVHRALLGDPDAGEFGWVSDARLFWVRVPKEGNLMTECEDAIAWSPDGLTVVVSDGAGSSFGAAAWAKVLADRFVIDPPSALSNTIFGSWLDTCRVALAHQSELEAATSNWWGIEGSRRGAFATIAGVRLTEVDGRLELLAMCVGDSCVMVLRGGAGARRVVRSVPFDDAKQFGTHPMLVGSPEEAVMPEPSWTTLQIEPGDLVLVASDAVSEWLLGDPLRVGAIDLLPEDLGERLRAERSAGRIVNDDLALVGITIP